MWSYADLSFVVAICMPIRAGYTIRNEQSTQQFKFGVISHITSLKRGDPAGYKSIEHEG